MPSHCVDRPLSRRTALGLGSAGVAALLATKTSGAAAAENSSALARNRDIVQRLFDAGVNAGDEAVLTSLYAPVIGADASWTSRMTAPVRMPISLHEFRTAAPSVKATVDAIVSEGDLVATLIAWRGMHPPAGTHIEGHTMHLFRIERDQVIEQWSVGWDWFEVPGE